MLIQFDVGNFKSFKDIVSFSMVASKIKEHCDTHVMEVHGKLKLLKSSVLYGANASGKSNLFSAMMFMKELVLESSKNMNTQDEISTDIFRLSSETETKPSHFQIIFIKNNIRYRYGFEATTNEIISEWLFRTTRVNNEVVLFEREGKNIVNGKLFSEGNGLEGKTRKNALFLSVVAQFNGEISGTIMDWFSDLIIISGLKGKMSLHASNRIFELAKNESEFFESVFLKYLKKADLGIVDVKLKKEQMDYSRFSPSLKNFLEKSKEFPSETTNVSILHSFFDEQKENVELKEFDLQKDESQGTIKLYSLMGPLVLALYTNEVLVVDELDSSFHPLITRFIVELFNSPDNENAQLIFNTHDTNLLNKKYLRRDQIWFAEKDSYGASDIYSLADFNVRNDATFEKDYLLGKYGSIPYLGNLDFDNCDKES